MQNFLISGAAPWVLAFLVLFLGIGSWMISGRATRQVVRWVLRVPSMLLVILGLAMLSGAAITAVKMGAARAEHPPPGKMVDVNGTDIHVWC